MTDQKSQKNACGAVFGRNNMLMVLFVGVCVLCVPAVQGSMDDIPPQDMELLQDKFMQWIVSAPEASEQEIVQAVHCFHDQIKEQRMRGMVVLQTLMHGQDTTDFEPHRPSPECKPYFAAIQALE